MIPKVQQTIKPRATTGLQFPQHLSTNNNNLNDKSFLRGSDAKAWLMQEEVRIQQGLNIEGSERKAKTLNEAIEKFIDNEPDHPYRTAHLREWQKSLQHKILLSKISWLDINEITSKWKKTGPFEIPLQHATLNRYLSSLSLLFESAKKWGWIIKNPVKESEKYQEPAGRVRYLNEDELGHKTLELVKRYSHLSDTHTASVVERMNQRMFVGRSELLRS